MYCCWIGKPNQLKIEIDKFIELIKYDVLKLNKSLKLSVEEQKGFDWIGEDQFKYFEGNQNGSVCLLTSGTTGKPKEIWKNIEQCLISKKGNGLIEDKWLLTYNPARWAGLSVILHCIKNNSQLIVPNDLSIENIANKFPEATHVSLTPSLFRKLLITNYDKLKNSNIKQITFGGEWANQKILNEAKSLWPTAKITHVYATTEIGDVCAVSDGLEGYPINKFKVPIKIKDSDLIIKGKSTGDLWEERDERIYFKGRTTEVINVGGAKITQSEVESKTFEIKEIKECKAYRIQNALLGEVVGLDYVGDVEPPEVKKRLSTLLPKFAVPLKINKVQKISLTAAGKIKR